MAGRDAVSDPVPNADVVHCLNGERLFIPAIASGGAALLHAAAAGIHAEHTDLARAFILLATLQGSVAVLGFTRASRSTVAAIVGVNLAAVTGWFVTRIVGVSWFAGLEVAERPQLADSVTAILALVAVVGAASTLLGSGATTPLPRGALVNASVLAGVLLVPALADATSHSHPAGHESSAADTHDHADQPADSDTTFTQVPASVHDDHEIVGDDDHEHDQPLVSDSASVTNVTSPTTLTASDEHHRHDDQGNISAAPIDAGGSSAVWPRPWDPAAPIDFSGVAGVTAEQQARAEALTKNTLDDLPAFANVDDLPALGYRSIGDASTGHEHYINVGLINDDRILDPSAPESLVFQVDGDQRSLVSAMFIVGSTPIDDPSIVDFAGPLMQWHVHDNLCWGLDDNGEPVVRSVLANPTDACPEGTVNTGGDNPMVHVWIAPHECGPFAALEGHGAGQTAVSDAERIDVCGGHAGHGAAADAAQPTGLTPYDPALPIDLGGIDGVTLEQQAFAENLVAATIRDLPRWADLAEVAAAGFRSIGDADTGHEHYIQWDWIDDDVWLDPDYPESLVFEPQPDGSKTLVSAMFMLPRDVPLADVPDFGGQLMQWHVHGDLCFTDDPIAPQVGGVREVGDDCEPPLVETVLAPMIHVWIRPHECGPFAALDGIGSGQVVAGEETWCDVGHGQH